MLNNNRVASAYYSKNDLNELHIPIWQRWVNPSNVKDLEASIHEAGILRALLIGELPGGQKVLYDGNHLRYAIQNAFKSMGADEKFIPVLVIQVETENEALKKFISFNTRGKTLKPLDFIVSYASAGNNDYALFMKEVLGSPKSWKDTKDIFADSMFSMTVLLKSFMGGAKAVKAGTAKIAPDYKELISLVKYLDDEYRKDLRILALRKNRHYGLNASSMPPILLEVRKVGLLKTHSNKDILDILVDFTEYFVNSNTQPSFQNGPISVAIKKYLEKYGEEKAA